MYVSRLSWVRILNRTWTRKGALQEQKSTFLGLQYPTIEMRWFYRPQQVFSSENQHLDNGETKRKHEQARTLKAHNH